MKTILLIEDNDEIRENTSEILVLAGYRVLTAENGEIGVDIAKKTFPDLILCDIMMPVLDGFGVFLSISKCLKTAGTPFIFLTARAEIEDKRYGIHLGVDDYITKPYDDSILLSTIKSKIQKQEKAKAEIEHEQSIYLKELEEMLHLTNHRVRAPLCTCLGLMQLLDKNINPNQTEEEVADILTHIKTSIYELDDFTKELTNFIDQASIQKKNKLGHNRT